MIASRTVALVIAVACGGGTSSSTLPSNTSSAPAPQPASSTPEALIAKLSEFKEAMCRCADASCTQNVTDRMTVWAHDASRAKDKDEDRGFKPPQFTPEQTDQVNALENALSECVVNAMTGSAGGSAGSGSAGSGSVGSGSAGSVSP